jgi:hypothetical protein
VVRSGIDVVPLLQQITDNPQLWNTNSVRTSKFATVHYDVDDIILRYPGHGLDNWNLAPFNVLTEAVPIVFDLAGRVRCELLGRVVISRLPPGKQIPTHKDHLGGLPMFYSRYQVPLVSAEDVIFHCGDEQLSLVPGNAYWFDNTIEHSVVNDSQDDRLSMIIDIRTFHPCE